MMFRQIYKDFTGQDILGESNKQPGPINSYLSGLQRAFEGD